MVECKNHTVTTWCITKASDDSVIHHSKVEVGQVLESGQEEIETFTTKQDWIDRLEELGVEITE